MALMTFDMKRNPQQARISLLALLALMIIFPMIAQHFGNSWVRIMDMALLYIMLALGLNVVVGFAGLLDLGYIAFYAIGAYTAGLLASPQFAAVIESFVNTYPDVGNFLVWLYGPQIVQNGIHLSLWLIVPISGVLAALFGALLGAPTLKLRGDYLAIVTLGFGEIIRIFMNNLNAPVNITNGPQGINLIDPIRVFGVSLAGEPGSGSMVKVFGMSLPSVNAYYYLFLVLCIFVIFFSVRLQDSRLGRAWVAIREDEIAAKAMGINTRNVKLLAFAMGASFGGVAGAMFGAFQGFVSPESFSLTESIAVLAMVVLGGIGHIPGVVLGGVILAALPEVLRHVVEPLQMAIFGRVWIDAEVLRQLLYGLAMVIIMLTRPAGLWPSPRHEDRPEVDHTKVGTTGEVKA
ncbi:ABC transporter ATP-binding protein [Herbaspirillum sp. BH-1]|uniref:Branched-chain amino acid transport system permease protein n=4 Tax=Herbaspirillum TaxID=963 RepID=A0ABU1PJZ8_9BURK|nr:MULTISPECIES: ABC transporter ATP-binding protein [Herbaspirillum]MDR6586256.1 branched-chain amino acid transport system permease protein [Herbaspirillum frisingense]PLY57157.1 ABC transporter ATP-binding protein [Herbaspirillum sp. BH-1]PLY58819.1 ABC transporter ATP-binding protein [Herbaspirillum sp. BH-1]